MPSFDAVVDMNENIQPNSDLLVRYTEDIKAKTNCAHEPLTVAWHLGQAGWWLRASATHIWSIKFVLNRN